MLRGRRSPARRQFLRELIPAHGVSSCHAQAFVHRVCSLGGLYDAGGSPGGVAGTAGPYSDRGRGEPTLPPATEPRPIEGKTTDLRALRTEHQRRCAARVGDPRTWRSVLPFEGDGWDKAERLSVCEWSVSVDSGSLAARIYDRNPASVALPFEPSQCPKYEIVHCACNKTAAENDPPLRVTDFLRTPTGYLVSYDSGEFGGGLSWFDASGTFRQQITGENTIRIVATPSGITAVSQTASMIEPIGHVLRLMQSGARWRFSRTKLPGVPHAVSQDSDGTMLVATDGHLVRIGSGGRLTVLHRGKWSEIVPRSIVKDDDGAIYLGGRFAVIRLRRAAKIAAARS